jgi:proline dehydrogenase
MGLTISPALAESIAESVAQHAAKTGSFVRIDMEDSSLTQVTMDIVHRLNSKPELHGAIGIVIQSYLFRSEKDVEQLVADGTRVRLCKGAYDEPATVAFPRKADVDTSYVRLSKMLLDSGVFHGFATHDEAMIDAIKSYAKERKIDPSHYEFQMLYGLRSDLQRKLVQDGYNVRVYVPFGDAWYPYYMRRLAERPANVLFMIKNLFHF